MEVSLSSSIANNDHLTRIHKITDHFNTHGEKEQQPVSLNAQTTYLTMQQRPTVTSTEVMVNNVAGSHSLTIQSKL